MKHHLPNNTHKLTQIRKLIYTKLFSLPGGRLGKLSGSFLALTIYRLPFWKHLNKKQRLYFQMAVGALLVVLVPLAIVSLRQPGKAAAWFNESWLYRATVPISSHTAAENNVYITVTIDTATPIAASKMQSGCGDLRFTKENGELLPYFINASPGCNNAATTIQVNFDSFPAGAQTIYYYYGNPSANSGQAPSAFSTEAANYVIGALGSETQGPGPVGYWNFDDGQGQTAQDSSSSGNDGTITGATWQPEDKCVSGKCLYFDGSTSYVDAGAGSSLDMGTNSFTIETWLRTSVGGSIRRLLIKRGSDGSQWFDLQLRDTNVISATIADNYPSNSFGGVTGTKVVTDGKWHHIVAVFNRSGNLQLFIDGVSDGTSSITSYSGSLNNDGHVFIGAYGTGTGPPYQNYLNGFLDEPKIYPYARSAAQVKTDYLAGASKAGASAKIGGNTPPLQGGQPGWMASGLLGYWNMDEATGSAVTDYSGNSNTGTLTNAQETGTAQTGGSTTTLIGASTLSATDDVYNGMIVSINGGSCGITAGTKRTISDYTGSSKTITVATAFSATTDGCGYVILHQVGGKYGNGVGFDGVDDYVNAGSGTSLNMGSNPLTFSAWIYPTRTPTTNGEDVIFGGESNAAILKRWAGGKLDFGKYGLSNATGSTSTVSLNTWTHIVVTFDGSSTTTNNLRYYINGQLDNTASYSVTAFTALTNNIGAGATGDYPFPGKIDEARIYNRALSPKEVSDLYNYAPGPVGYWRMDDKVTGASKTIVDASGNGNNGTTYSANGTGMSCNLPGKYGSGCQFDGTDDYIEAPYSQNLDITGNQITLSAWINPLSARDQDWEGIVGNYPGNTTGYGLLWRENTNNNFTFVLELTSGHKEVTISNFANYASFNTWNHVVGTYDGSAMRIYLNGVLINTTSSLSGTIISSSQGVRTGRYASSYVNGKIDDVKIYNYARSAKQIAEDMLGGGSLVGSNPRGSGPSTSGVNAPVGYWDFDEGYGQFANNSGSKGLALRGALGTDSSAGSDDPSWTTSGKFGKALSFDGGDYIEIADNDAFDPTEITISAWFNPTNLAAASVPISHGNNTNGWYLQLNTNGTFGFYTGSSGKTSVRGTVSTGSWQHVVVTHDGINDKFYINGKLTDTLAQTTAITNLSQVFRMGRWSNGNYYYNGLLDEVKIYSYALTSDEVKVEYNRGSSLVWGSLSNTSSLTGGNVASNSASAEYCIPGDTAACSAPVGRWDFEEGKDNTCTGGANDVCDTSGTGNDGAITGGATWASGKIGKALKFDGVDDYVNHGTSSTLSPTSAITVSVWVKPIKNAVNQVVVANGDGIWQRGWAVRIPDYTTKWEVAINTEAVGGTDPPGNARLKLDDTTINFNQWQHIAWTYDGSTSSFVYYFNGVRSTNYTRVGGGVDPNGNLKYTSNRPVRVAASGDDSTPTNFFTGLIDNIRVFNYIRTPAQIAYDFNRGAPVGHWDFDECQGTTAHDLSGNWNNGTITIGGSGTQTAVGTCAANATTAWYSGRTGKRNASLNFDGTDDYVAVSSTGLIGNSKAMTVSAWVNTTSAGGVIYGEGNVSSSNPVIQMEISSSKMYAFIRDDAGTYNLVQNSGPNITNGGWTHMAMTVDANGKITGAYINGKLIGSATTNTLSTLTTTNTKIGTLFYGAYPSGYDFFNGQIDDVKVFNYALTAQQVKTEYNNGAVNFGPVTGAP